MIISIIFSDFITAGEGEGEDIRYMGTKRIENILNLHVSTTSPSHCLQSPRTIASPIPLLEPVTLVKKRYRLLFYITLSSSIHAPFCQYSHRINSLSMLTLNLINFRMKL